MCVTDKCDRICCTSSRDKWCSISVDFLSVRTICSIKHSGGHLAIFFSSSLLVRVRMRESVCLTVCACSFVRTMWCVRNKYIWYYVADVICLMCGSHGFLGCMTLNHELKLGFALISIFKQNAFFVKRTRTHASSRSVNRSVKFFSKDDFHLFDR